MNQILEKFKKELPFILISCVLGFVGTYTYSNWDNLNLTLRLILGFILLFALIPYVKLSLRQIREAELKSSSN